jgi:hypothetical protein
MLGHRNIDLEGTPMHASGTASFCLVVEQCPAYRLQAIVLRSDYHSAGTRSTLLDHCQPSPSVLSKLYSPTKYTNTYYRGTMPCCHCVQSLSFPNGFSKT